MSQNNKKKKFCFVIKKFYFEKQNLKFFHWFVSFLKFNDKQKFQFCWLQLFMNKIWIETFHFYNGF